MSAIRPIHRRTRSSVLRRGDALLLDDARGTILAVEHGCLWVTLEHDPRDIILSAGMRFEIDRRGRTIVAAEADSALRILAPVRLRDRIVAAFTRARARLLNGRAGRLSERALYF